MIRTDFENRRIEGLTLFHRKLNYHFAKPGLVDELRFPWWRRPLTRIDLLHVIHKVKTERPGCARIQHREYSRLAIGRHFGHSGESGARSICIVNSQPSFIPRFSAAIDGCRIHVCKLCTVSS